MIHCGSTHASGIDGAIIRRVEHNSDRGNKRLDLTLTAYNNSCKEMRSEARDATIRGITETRLGEDGKWEQKVRG